MACVRVRGAHGEHGGDGGCGHGVCGERGGHGRVGCDARPCTVMPCAQRAAAIAETRRLRRTCVVAQRLRRLGATTVEALRCG